MSAAGSPTQLPEPCPLCHVRHKEGRHVSGVMALSYQDIQVLKKLTPRQREILLEMRAGPYRPSHNLANLPGYNLEQKGLATSNREAGEFSPWTFFLTPVGRRTADALSQLLGVA